MLTRTFLRKASKPGSGKTLVLFGATGFVGSNIGEIAHARGWNIIATCVEGSGPAKGSHLETLPWAQQATWAKLDGNDRADVYAFLEDVAGGKTGSSNAPVTALINSIGTLTHDHAVARRDNTSSVLNTVAAINEGKAPASINQFVYISTADVAFAKPFLSGYYHGKRESEKTLQKYLPSSIRHTILRPALIHGKRYMPGGNVGFPSWLVGLPLELVGAPVSHFFPADCPPPPISVTNVAKAAVYSIEEGASKEFGKSGLYEYAEIKDLAKRLA